jgi:hypothetical protein
MKLRGQVESIDCLGQADREAMFQLMVKTYANKQRERFEEDLKAKQWVILVRRQADGRLAGFSTQTLLEILVQGQLVSALYSGDTVIDRGDWGDPALANAWGNFALELIDQHSAARRPFYWFLTSKGFRTYRYLPLFFRVYFPNAVVATPRGEQAIIDSLGRRFGGDRYDSAGSIIHADEHSDFVRSEIANLGARRDSDPNVRFFAEQNPGAAYGDEMCCLASLSRSNFTPAAYRVMGLKRQPAAL